MKKNIVELRDDLGRLFEEIKSESVEVGIAAEMNNTAGKIINTLKVELEYSAQKKSAPNIAYLEY